MKTVFSVLLLIGLIAGGAAAYQGFFSAEAPGNFRTATVKRGDLVMTIGATGPLEPEEVVDVGAQVVGPISALGDDPRGESDPLFKGKKIDYNSPVHEGTPLVKIDDRLYQATKNQAVAALAKAEADLVELEAKREQTEAEWQRAKRLHEIKLSSLSSPVVKETQTSALTILIKGISDSDYILAKANKDVAAALVKVGTATIEQQEAALKQADTNLGYTTICSPVEGTIIARRVNIGQTVVATFTASSLFLIAKDLRKMQVWASVNEADIGRLKVGTPVTFSVDAFPDDIFHGQVAQIRLNATMTQNVTTYTVVVSFDNSDMKLIPYLTADIKFEVERRSDVLLVPNAALHWQPRVQQVVPELRDAVAAAAFGSGKSPGKSSEKPSDKTSSDKKQDGQGKPAKSAKKPSAGKSAKSTRSRKERDDRGTLWVKDGEFVRPVAVRIGASDTSNTEVTGRDVKEDLEVVLAEIKSDRPTDTTNPFAPRIFRWKQPQSSSSKNPGGGK